MTIQYGKPGSKRRPLGLEAGHGKKRGRVEKRKINWIHRLPQATTY